ncbi:MAG: 1,4-alpha-glucan branching protein GlgB [Desulfobacterota bacterium]|nr:1,4-alpha-glucan branching protein GlgB [Thermodesulfobacteriota bacterium]
MKATIPAAQIRKIVKAEHHDPFDVLGMHRHPAKTNELVVRTMQPDAVRVHVIPIIDRIAPQPMHKIHPDGLFEAVFTGIADFFEYRLEIHYPNKAVVAIYDPYSFLPVLSEYDLHLFAEGNHHRIYEKLGSHKIIHRGIPGMLFAVWAPNAQRVSVVGDFNCWDGRRHPMRVRGMSGVWELFIPELGQGELYKYEIRAKNGDIIIKTDPYARRTEVRPKTAAITHTFTYSWQDETWMRSRDLTTQLGKPISIYEVHLGSWRRVAEEGNRPLTYREAAHQLIPYVKDMGYTHIEFLPLAAHPFDPSWGYQVTGYYSCAGQYGEPEDLMYLIDQCHQHGIGVIMDWVPAHFPTDAHALAWFDGTALYEHADPRLGYHPDWGTLVFNYGRNEVRNFLIANALFWFDHYHVDGLRVDAVASMLYLDYSRKEGEWIPNEYGGRENLAAINFLRQLNEIVYRYYPGVLMIAEESTAWPQVSRPTYLGGLGFAMKWNMGWMHDMLEYMKKDPIFRKYHHNMLTFALLYSFHENFILPFSHDEVVHGKGSMLGKMPGDRWQQFANMRLLLGYMFAHPGKKHLFMGIDIGQWSEWDHNGSVAWELLQYEPHQKLQAYVRALNRLYRTEPALHELDFDYHGFEWIDFTDWENSIVSFIRRGRRPDDIVICAYNFTPVVRERYRIGVPLAGVYEEILNSDAHLFGGSNVGNLGRCKAEAVAAHGRPYSLSITLPPLGCVFFKPQQ